MRPPAFSVPLFLALGLWLVSGGARAAEPGGGSGSLHVLSPGQVHCFKTSSKPVTEGCGTFEVKWKIWTLVGEPVENYVLSWKLQTVRITDGHEKGSRSYQVDSLPAELSRAAMKSELSVAGIAFLQNQAALGTAAIAFDTGAAVRPGGTASFNVPGSAAWDRWIIQGSSLMKGLDGWCEPRGRTYADAAQARLVMRKGIQLGGLILCPATSLDASSLASAVDSYCETSSRPEKPSYCSPAPKERPARNSVGDSLDALADAPKLKTILAGQRATFQQQAARVCNQEMQQIEACTVRSGCAVPSGPTVQTCSAVPARPSAGFSMPTLTAESYDCDARCKRANRAATREREEKETRQRSGPSLAERQTEWDQNWLAVSQQCAAGVQARKEFEQCKVRAQPQCNARAVTHASCVQARMAAAPTQGDATRTLEAERKADSNTAAGKRPSFLD